jgi:hypothetical protein
MYFGSRSSRTIWLSSCRVRTNAYKVYSPPGTFQMPFRCALLPFKKSLLVRSILCFNAFAFTRFAPPSPSSTSFTLLHRRRRRCQLPLANLCAIARPSFVLSPASLSLAPSTTTPPYHPLPPARSLFPSAFIAGSARVAHHSPSAFDSALLFITTTPSRFDASSTFDQGQTRVAAGRVRTTAALRSKHAPTDPRDSNWRERRFISTSPFDRFTSSHFLADFVYLRLVKLPNRHKTQFEL